MDRYAHVRLLDMNAALESLPGMPHRQGSEQARNVSSETDPKLIRVWLLRWLQRLLVIS
jgi:hypothetical protein